MRMGEARQPDEPGAAMLQLPGEWVERALCRKVDPELFFPAAGRHPTSAKKICARCPVQPDCLGWALANNEEFGVWGGTSEQERRRMRAKRGKFKPGRRPHRSSVNVELED